jgi:hypothetical protein
MNYLLLIPGLALLLLARWIARQVAIRVFMQRTRAKHPPTLAEDRGFLGMKAMSRSLAAMERGEFTKMWREQFEWAGQTYRMPTGHIATIDIENIKALYGNLDMWIVGPRKIGWAPLLSKGIFVSDGKEWEHSRVRPVQLPSSTPKPHS